MSGNELSVNIASHELRVRGEIHQEVDIGGETLDVVLRQTRPQLPESRVPVLTPDHELGDHRIIVNTDLVTLSHTSLYPDIITSLGSSNILQRTCSWHETVVGILRVDSGLE